MQHGYGLSIPQTLEEACDPHGMAIIVYDMQVGIVSQLSDGDKIVQRIVRIREAARRGGYPVFYTRHFTVPPAVAGVSQLRTAMQWQRVNDVSSVRPAFPQGSPQYQLTPELSPGDDEVVIDKITMSCFAGSPLDIILRDRGIGTFVIAGIAMEVGIEPSVRHGMDLGYLPVLVQDACGAGDPSAAERSHASLEFAGGSLSTDTETLVALLGR